MAMLDQDFWRRAENAAPGLFDFGTGVYGMRAGRKEAEQRLAASRDPYYQQATGAASGALTRAGSMDPRAAAQERFNAAQGMLAPKDAADMEALQRMLQLRGQGGAATYSGVAPGGAPINPQMAAYLAEKNRRDERLAFDALNEGENQTDRMLQRAGMLNQQAVARQNANLAASRVVPSRSAANMNVLKGAASILKDTGLMKNAMGLFGKGFDWLGDKTGLWGGFDPSMADEWGGDLYDW